MVYYYDNSILIRYTVVLLACFEIFSYYKILIIIMCSEASKVLLAETWSEDVDPTGWWMSEKLDGVRYDNLL